MLNKILYSRRMLIYGFLIAPSPSQIPIYTPGWREALIVTRHLAEGRKHGGANWTQTCMEQRISSLQHCCRHDLFYIMH